MKKKSIYDFDFTSNMILSYFGDKYYQISKHLFCNKLDTVLLQYFNRYNTRHLLAESLLSGDWQKTEFLRTNTKYNQLNIHC